MELSPDGSRSGKRKHPTEDAKGPAWGAQSFSAARNNAINKSMRDSGKDPGFGDFGRYFSEKKRKLRDQYHENATASFTRESPPGMVAPPMVPEIDIKIAEKTDSGEVNKQLFTGVTIFVDGFTTPTHQELRFLMMNHGGVFENYFSSQRVTHIICSTLPDSKIMNPRLMSRGVPIVKPEWIVDSIKENRLLSWDSYQHERIAYSHPHQRTLSASFSARKLDGTTPASTKVVNMDAPTPVNVEKENTVYMQNEVMFPATDIVGEPDGRVVKEQLDLESSKTPEEVAKVQFLVPLPTDSKLHERDMVELEIMDGNEREIMPDDDVPEVAVALKEAKQKGPAGRGRSTLDDPDFVQSYFKYSRLHFIGTWRNRYQSLVNSGSFGNPEPGFGTDRVLPAASSSGRPAIIHLDMDCFFVSVVVRNRPALDGKPVAVCHSDSAQGTGEISSANYPARSYGIRAGMFVRDAKARCPELAIVPYDFAAYEQVADTVYSILHHHCSTVQAVSCDEAFLDVSGHPDPANLASRIREEIFQATHCTASAGIAENLLLARLATKKAKPNGQHVIQPDEVKEFMAALPLDQLPGVGWTLREKLHGHGLKTCADLQSVSKEILQKDYGAKTGVMLWSYAQGIDDREVQPAQERKSIGAEVNWGVRFSCMDDAQQFLVTLSNEVAARLQKASSSGRTITLKVKRRKEGVGEPVKFMGCGVCDNLSRSETVGYATDSAEILLRIGRQLFASLHLDVQEVRGVGLQISRLESTNTGTRKQHNALDSWLAPPSKLDMGKGGINQITDNIPSIFGEEPEERNGRNGAGLFASSDEIDTAEGLKQRQHIKSDLHSPVTSGRETPIDVQRRSIQTNNESKAKRRSSLELPPLSQLDRSVLEFLPEDIVAEINDASKAQEELKQREHMDRKVDLESRVVSGEERPSGGQLQSRSRKLKNKPQNSYLELPPRSQLDPSVLESLPEDIVAEINDASKAQEELKQREHVDRKVDPESRVISGEEIPSGGQLQSRTRRDKNKPRNSFLQLPPQSELDPSVLESLPEDILAEINHAYEQEILRSSSRQPSSHPSNLQADTSGNTASLKEKTPINVPGAVDQGCGSNDSTKQSQHIGMKLGSTAEHAVPKSLIRTGSEDYCSMLQNILESVNSGPSSRSLSSDLLSLGCYLPVHDSRDITGLEQVIQLCFRQLIQYVQDIASKDLEEVHLVLLYTKRLGSRCKLWKAVQELAMPAVKDVIGELYGGQLSID